MQSGIVVVSAGVIQEWTQRLPGLDDLWSRTKGHPDVRVAVLDGPIASGASRPPSTASHVEAHGTLVHSIIAGSPDGAVSGLSPQCTIFSIPIFDAAEDAVCSQSRLASAIREALDRQANVINVSASQQADLLAVSNELSTVLQRAAKADVLIVAAAGNQGCACDTIPASVPGVLAVGSHDLEGEPLASSNWGFNHRSQGIIAPGFGIPGACVEGGICRASGTSFATATVSGIAALLMSLDAEDGVRPGGERTRRALLESSVRPAQDDAEISSTYLAGRLDVAAALQHFISSRPINAGESHLTAASHFQDSISPPLATAAGLSHSRADDVQAASTDSAQPMGLVPADCGCGGPAKESDCGCGGGAKKPQLVYAIGRLGVSFVNAARRDSLWRTVNGGAQGDLKMILDKSLADLFKKNPFQSQSVIWTLSRSEVPMYAIVPSGAFAAETYKWMVEEWTDPAVEFVSVPGVMAGQATLYDGNIVDLIVPDLRGMHSWATKQYVKALTDGRKKVAGTTDESVRREMDRFLGKIYFAIRNRGLSPEERALNAAATNAFNFSPVIVEAGQEGLTLRDVSVERSPLNRPGSEYYDVLLTFFNPKDRQGTAPLRARFTIDVSDTVPVMIGEPVIWYEY